MAHDHKDAPSTTQPRPKVTKRRATCLNSPAQDFGIDQGVRHSLQKILRQAPLAVDSTSDDPSSSEEDPITRRKRRTLKSGMEWMGTTLIKKSIPWPHEGAYTGDGKLAAYRDLTFAAFVRGYLMVVNMETDTRIKKSPMLIHLEDLMEDLDLYCWTRVRSFHAAVLNQIEKG